MLRSTLSRLRLGLVRHKSSGYASNKSVEVLLARDKPGLGLRGDVVNVKPGYARHRLIPKGDAVRTILRDEVAAVRAQLEMEDAAERARLQPVAQSLGTAQLSFVREASKSGTLGDAAVTAADIAEQLTSNFGLEVGPAQVTPATVETVGEHMVTVRLGRVGLPATVRLTIAATNVPKVVTGASESAHSTSVSQGSDPVVSHSQ